MSRYIDAEELKTEVSKASVWTELAIKNIINRTSCVDIVRCKECKHCYTDGENVVFNVCELNHNKVQSDEWYCADGERREP